MAAGAAVPWAILPVPKKLMARLIQLAAIWQSGQEEL